MTETGWTTPNFLEQGFDPQAHFHYDTPLILCITILTILQFYIAVSNNSHTDEKNIRITK